jgi:SET domain-containing protein
MLYVKTYIRASSIHGVGLFAAEFIPSGTVIWKFFPRLDMSFTPEEYDELSHLEEFRSLMKYIYKSRISGNYILCADNARFINHSPEGNTIEMPDDLEGLTIAAKDILPDEEIISDYSAFDAAFVAFEAQLQAN